MSKGTLSRHTENRQWQIIQTRSDPDISLKSLARIQRIAQNENLTPTQSFTHPCDACDKLHIWMIMTMMRMTWLCLQSVGNE